ncbi:MAG: hypothetical protein EA409_00040 [Saprospirales bacterium]|nr:MAG: hypothetical protein EA409_00040 [Saprospirales bacterium]
MKNKYSPAVGRGNNLWADILSMDRSLDKESKQRALLLIHQYWLVVESIQRLKIFVFAPEWEYMRNKSAGISCYT